MIEFRAHGKLFVAGEYAVVEPGQPSVLIALDRAITARVSEGHGSPPTTVHRRIDTERLSLRDAGHTRVQHGVTETRRPRHKNRDRSAT